MPKVDRPLKHTQLLSLIRSGCNELDNGSMWALVPGDPVQTKLKLPTEWEYPPSDRALHRQLEYDWNILSISAVSGAERPSVNRNSAIC